MPKKPPKRGFPPNGTDSHSNAPRPWPSGRKASRKGTTFKPGSPTQESRETHFGIGEHSPNEVHLRDRALRPPSTPNADHETRRRSSSYARTRSGIAIIYGIHSVREALRSQRRKLIRLLATQAAADRLSEDLSSRGLEPEIASGQQITRLLPPGVVHQGVLLECRPLEPVGLSALPSYGTVLVLDQITDPHNVGAIFRTAAAFGVSAIVMTERHSPDFTSVLAKTASGGLEHVPAVSVVNLSRALEELGDVGYFRVGLDSDAPSILGQIPLSFPLALVLGAEEKGLRRLSRTKCDVLARLDMPGQIKSLNVSNACAVALAIVRLTAGN